MDAYPPVILSVTATVHLRSIDPRRDLLAIADLVELCFRETLDADGYQYLRQMRNLARNSTILTFAYNLAESAARNPTQGFVWEQDDQIVGNVSLLSVFTRGQFFYLIANVAVHPDYRGQGIGRALTAAALNQARQQGKAVWLQVRQENAPAVHLYRSLGFRERATRTTWRANPGMPRRPLAVGYSVQPRHDDDWRSQLAWLDSLYPPDLRWHLTLDRNLLQPGPTGWFYRLMSLEVVKQWSVWAHGRLAGVLSWHVSHTTAQNLWLAAPPQADQTALTELLCTARWQINSKMQTSFNLECPADFAVSPLTEAGFYAHQTLIWMDYP